MDFSVLHSLDPALASARAKSLAKTQARLNSVSQNFAPPSRHLTIARQSEPLIEHAGVSQSAVLVRATLAEMLSSPLDEPQAIGTVVRTRAAALVDAVAELCDRCRAVGWFGPADDTTAAAAALARAGLDLAERVLAALSGGADAEAASIASAAFDECAAAAAQPAARDEGGAVARVRLAFGLSETEADGLGGRISAARILAASRSRHGELGCRTVAILSHLGRPVMPLPDAVWAAQCLVATDMPVLSNLTAWRLVQLVEQVLDEDSSAAIEPLRAIKLNADRGFTSSLRISDAQAALVAATSDRARARALMDIHEGWAEGQIRPWAWALVRLRGGKGTRMPELAALRKRLLDDGHPLLADVGRALDPALRNASAHHDFVFDDARGCLVTASGDVWLDDITAAIARLQSLLGGLEAALAVLRHSRRDLAAGLDADGQSHLPSIRELHIHWLLGSNGLWIDHIERRGAELHIALQRLADELVSSCLHALTVASAVIDPEITAIAVTVPGIERPVIELNRSTLQANAVIVMEAQRSFKAMPPCTYLPALISARLSVEPPDVAVDAAAWLAANEALGLLEDADQRPPHPELEPRFELLLCALATTFDLLADDHAATYGRLIDALKDARVGARLHDGQYASYGLLRRAWDHIDEIHDARPGVAVLPTLNPAPLDS